MFWIVLVLAIFIAIGQFIHRQAEKLREEERREKAKIVVRIRIAGDMATRDEVHARLAAEHEIEQRGIGKSVDAGSGGGMMFFVVALNDPDNADAVRNVLAGTSLDILGIEPHVTQNI